MVNAQRTRSTHSFQLSVPRPSNSLDQMALNHNNPDLVRAGERNTMPPPTAALDLSQDKTSTYYDTEKNGIGGPRRGSRIDKPIEDRGLDTDSDSNFTVGKQMELEAGNAIKYRTCSWPKVLTLFVLYEPMPAELPFIHVLTFVCVSRPLRCCSRNISAWLSCPSPIRILFLVWCPASS